MPPKRKLETVSKHPKDPSNNMRANRKTNTRLRQNRSRAATAANCPAFQTCSKPSAPSQELETAPRTRAQKRKFTDENEDSQKRPRRDPSSALTPAKVPQEPVRVFQTLRNRQGNKRQYDFEDEPTGRRRRPSVTQTLLSEKNLKKLESEMAKSRKIEHIATPSERARKRGPSGQASFSDLQSAASTRSLKSAGSLKFYRYNILARASVYVCPEPPPPEIQSQLDVVFTREISGERRAEISRIAKETTDQFIDTLRGAYREDDLVEPLRAAFCAMFKDGTFDCPRKAGWNPELKPGAQQGEELWNLDAPSQLHDEADDAVNRPSKRRRAGQSLPSLDASPPTIQPPAASAQLNQDGAVKTPRPDVTIGLRHATIANALVARGLSKLRADSFLRALQRKQKLYSDPTVDYLDVRFPIQVIEGKAYTTGKTVFEAENQSTVSGACMVNLQQQFTDLYESIFPDTKVNNTPFAFSVCTEGPVIQFWVSYFRTEENIRMHYMNLLCICHGSLHDTLEVLLMKWEQLMNWYREDFLKETVDRLYRLAKHMARS